LLLQALEQQSVGALQWAPGSPQVLVTQPPSLHVVIPVGLMQQSEVWVQLCPLVAQFGEHTLPAQFMEQQSVFAEQPIPSPEQEPEEPQVPPSLQKPLQHCKAVVHEAPRGAQPEDATHSPSAQAWEQQSESPLHDAPLDAHPRGPHTLPLHA
jgi:hypothetical protein